MILPPTSARLEGGKPPGTALTFPGIPPTGNVKPGVGATVRVRRVSTRPLAVLETRVEVTFLPINAEEDAAVIRDAGEEEDTWVEEALPINEAYRWPS